MFSNLLRISLVILQVSLVFSFYIRPLTTGTLKIEDQHFRQAKRIQKHIDVNLSKEYYENHKDIQTLAAITSLSMDQNLNFHFGYKIICPKQDCLLNLTLIRYTQTVNPNFRYSVTIDYIVAHGLKIFHTNVTSFQWHVFLSDVRSYDQNNNKQHLEKNLPYNNADAWYMMLFVNGFNNLTLTGHMVYSYIITTDMYVIHYMDHTNGHGEHDYMGWPQDGNYIRYTIAFIPQEYLKNYNCKPEQKFKLNDNYERVCDGEDNVKWFYGFKGTKEISIKGQFIQQKSGFSFQLEHTPSRYGLMAFPFQVNQNFTDERVHLYKQAKKDTQASLIDIIVWICFGLGLAVLLCIYLSKYQLLKLFKPKQDVNAKTLNEEVVSESNQSSVMKQGQTEIH